MKNTFISLVAGCLFGVGIIVAGMSNPAKVLGFLDLTGEWDPSLMLVMVGAIAVGLLAFGVAKKRPVSFLGLPMQLPTARNIDFKLVLGSALFGIGWGMAGICPGPALVLVGFGGSSKIFYFIGGLLFGMLVFELWQRTLQRQS